MPKSVLYVPLVAGGEVDGRRSRSRTSTGSTRSATSDQQLLETLAGSLSVALENARLVHETRQRNAELALINSVQEALAGELDLQAIYDVVGDKIQEIFDAQVVDIGIFDFEAGLHALPVHDRARRPLPGRAGAARSATDTSVLETKAPVLINDVPAWERERRRTRPVAAGEPTLSISRAARLRRTRSAGGSRCRTSTGRTRSRRATSAC